ncbi:MAG TPA: hypothetical protein VFB14_26520 [Bryobacteraceae bacterium]|nr:hypothetical protein [Bryobacteraceae bacterium]
MKKTRLLLLTVVCAGAAAGAQMPGPPGGPPHGPGRFERGMGPMMRPWKIVTGAPYSADTNDYVVQTFADGNTIQRTTTAHVARDSQGRTYMQQTFTSGPMAQNGPTTITFITDPVAGYSYVLNSNTKTAMRRVFKTPPAPPNGVGPRARRQSSSTNVVTTDLGTQMVNGVNAQGTRITRTIPAGTVGNAQPIVSTSETWYSPDLQIVVSSKHSDPRVGQATYTVNNIQRGDPNSSLFQVPSDYTVQDASFGRGRWGGPPPPPQ